MALSKLTVRRLTKLADFMDSLPKSAKKHFNMGTWFAHKGDHDHEIGKYVTADALNHCGTTACALGWAATIPSFKRAGLKVRAVTSGGAPMRAGIAFFRLTPSQAEELFVDIYHQVGTPKRWARHCRKFISEKS